MKNKGYYNDTISLTNYVHFVITHEETNKQVE